MSVIVSALLLVVGFVVLIKGANFFVDGASDVAERCRVSKVVIGLTVVAFGTSAPELAVSISSLLSGHGDILLGNVIGANIANILFILGISALFATLKVQRATVRKEIPVMILLTVAFIVLLMDPWFGSGTSFLSRQDSVILMLFFAIFIYYLIGSARRKQVSEDEVDKAKIKGQNAILMRSNVNRNTQKLKKKAKPERPMRLPKALAIAIIGMIGIVIGSQLVVNNATEIATIIGWSDKLISLTIVALGTTLPELTTCVIAARKGETDIVIGNIVGSIIFNIGLVVGLPVMIFGGISGGSFTVIDLVFMFGSTIILFLFSQSNNSIVKKEGIVLLLLFVIYYAYIISSNVSAYSF